MEKRFPESESENRGDSVKQVRKNGYDKTTDKNNERGYRSKEREKYELRSSYTEKGEGRTLKAGGAWDI